MKKLFLPILFVTTCLPTLLEAKALWNINAHKLVERCLSNPNLSDEQKKITVRHIIGKQLIPYFSALLGATYAFNPLGGASHAILRKVIKMVNATSPYELDVALSQAIALHDSQRVVSIIRQEQTGCAHPKVMYALHILLIGATIVCHKQIANLWKQGFTNANTACNSASDWLGALIERTTQPATAQLASEMEGDCT
jgi:hypothetical protein